MVYGLFCPHRFSISSILYSQRLNTSLDGKGTCERGKQVSYINAYMWNLEKMVLMNLLENGFVDTAEGKGRAN